MVPFLHIEGELGTHVLESFVLLFQLGVGGQQLLLGLIQVVLQLLHLFLESAHFFLRLFDDSFRC